MIGNKGRSSKNGVGWSQRQRIPEKMVFKFAAGKEVRGRGHKLEQEASLGLFCPNTVEDASPLEHWARGPHVILCWPMSLHEAGTSLAS